MQTESPVLATDLNHVSPRKQQSSHTSPSALGDRAQSKKPFDVLAEGLELTKIRGDKTAIELFIAGVQGWEAGLRRQMDDRKSKLD